MTPANHELIQQATQSLRLRDITLYASRFERPQPTELLSAEALQQYKRETAYGVGGLSNGEEKQHSLQVTVSLGTRVVWPQKDAEPTVLFLIEADFVVEYEMTGTIDDKAIKEFADFNSVHNVWPFWRQHVFDIVQRGHLPKLDIPLFSGMKSSTPATTLDAQNRSTS